MSSMSLPMEKHQTFIKFKRGDIINARGQIGVIVDVLQSMETENICLYMRFVHSVRFRGCGLAPCIVRYDFDNLLPSRI